MADTYSDFGSLSFWRRVFDDETRAREFLEQMLWPKGAFCPHCGSVKVWRFRAEGRKSRDGLWECGDCRRQFTCTTKTPLHATKLPLGKWLEAFYIILSSSKGVSSVVLARMLGTTQKTAWKIGHAFRELVLNRPDLPLKLDGTVEVDTLFAGGAPKRRKHVWNPPGKGSRKTKVLLMVQRDGAVRATVVPSESAEDIGPPMLATIDTSAKVMSDGDKAIAKVSAAFAGHHYVRHSMREYAFQGVHVNTAEGYNLLFHRAIMGVYHHIDPEFTQRYLDEICFRWSQRTVVPMERKPGTKVQKIISCRPFHAQMHLLLKDAVGRQLRWAKGAGLRWPHLGDQNLRPAPVRWKRKGGPSTRL